jgi:hypothetical protein
MKKTIFTKTGLKNQSNEFFGLIKEKEKIYR